MSTSRVTVLIVLAVGALLTWYWLRNLPERATVALETPRAVKGGEIFEVPLTINSPRAMNAAELYFQFDPKRLELKEIRKSGSFFALWVKDSPSFSNEKGEIALAGGLPNPGFVGEGLIATLVFEAKMAGSTAVKLDEERSRVLENDGRGTKIEVRYSPAIITIREE